MTKTNSTDVRGVSRLLATALVVGVALLQAAPKDLPRTFTSPQEIIQATIEAAEHNDTAALLQLFGTGRQRYRRVWRSSRRQRSYARSLPARLTSSFRSTRTP